MVQEIFPRSNKLVAYRLAMRLTQEEVAAGMDRLAREFDGVGANVTAEMVSRWERGHRRPSRYYRRLLCRFYDVSEVELGLRLPPISRYAGAQDASPEVEVKRREFLYFMALLAGVSTLDLERMAYAFDRPGPASDQLMDYLHRVALGYASDAHTQAPGLLLSAVNGHVACLHRLLEASQPDSAGRRLRLIAGEAEALAGWLSYLLDSNQAAAARYATAEALATEAGDGPLRAHVLTLRSWLYSSVSRQAPGESGLTAITLLDEAVASMGSPHPTFKAWVLARRAQQHASAHDGLAANRDLDTIGAVLGSASRQPHGFLARWRPEARVASSRGKCALFLREPDAIDILEEALDRTDPALTAQRSAIENDLAAGCVLVGDPDVDRACAVLGDSLSLAGRIGAKSCVEHARDVRRFLEPWRMEPTVRQLDEQFHALAG